MRRLTWVFCFTAVVLAHQYQSAEGQTYYGFLSGLQERPTPVVTLGNGFGTAVFDSVANTLSVEMSYSDLTQPAADAHIHCCTTSALSVGVAVGFTGSGGFVTGATSGTYSHVFNLLDPAIYNTTFRNANGGTATGARDALIAAFNSADPNNPGSTLAYFNIHTQFRPGGEIRGNIFRVPEPSSLMLAAIGLVGLLARRRKS